MRPEVEEADHWRQTGGDAADQQGRVPLPQMDSAHDPTMSPPDSESSSRAYRDKDDNPYVSGPRPRICRQYGATVGHTGKQISVQACADIPRRIQEWQDYRKTLQAWNAANQEFMTPAQTLQKMCQVFSDAGETAAADSLNFLLVEYQQPTLPLMLCSGTLTF